MSQAEETSVGTIWHLPSLEESILPLTEDWREYQRSWMAVLGLVQYFQRAWGHKAIGVPADVNIFKRPPPDINGVENWPLGPKIWQQVNRVATVILPTGRRMLLCPMSLGGGVPKIFDGVVFGFDYSLELAEANLCFMTSSVGEVRLTRKSPNPRWIGIDPTTRLVTYTLMADDFLDLLLAPEETSFWFGLLSASAPWLVQIDPPEPEEPE